MFFDCPECGQTLKAADDAGGKKCRCTKCQAMVTIPGGEKKSPPTARSSGNYAGRNTQPSSTSSPRPSPPANAPKPTVASELDDIIVRQQEQFLQQSAERHVQREASRRRVESQQQNRKYYEPRSSTSSPLKMVMGFISIIGMLLVLGCCGLLGFFIYGNKQDLVGETYTITANGIGTKKSSTFGLTKGEGLTSRQTGSDFWLYEANFPDPSSAEIMRQRFESNCSSKENVQRGNLSGTHYSRVDGSALNLPQGVHCELEVFVDRSRVILAGYLRGSVKHSAGYQSRSRWESLEDSLDRSESFFSSLRIKQ